LNPLLLLLLTPSFASWLNDDQTFLHDALSNVFQSTQATHEFNVLAAVVDGLPSPKLHPWTSAHQKLGIVENLSLQDGREGVAVLIAESMRIAPDLFTTTRSMDDLDPADSNRPNTISFHLQPTSKALQQGAYAIAPKRHASYEIELPLANTIFRNGLTSTMFASRWARSGSSMPLKLEMVEKRALRHQRILMPVNADNGTSDGHFLEVPLQRLTVPWIVASAMGNILRQLYTDATASKTMPASEGLETAVGRFLTRANRLTSSQSFTVWALITPKERWHGEPTAQDATILGHLQNGSRLHRVLSGGGGYGKKMGLLALDPDTAYSSGSESAAFGTGEDLYQEEKDALGEVVKPGDVIQFFIHTSGATPKTVEGRRTGFDQAEIEFGTIPSTIDSMPDPSTEPKKTDGTLPINYRTDIFGALSEQGLSLTIDSHGPEGMETFGGAHRLGRVVQSKIDVPFTRYRLRYHTGRFKKHTAYNLMISGENPIGKYKAVDAIAKALDDILAKSAREDKATAKQETGKRPPKIRDDPGGVIRFVTR